MIKREDYLKAKQIVIEYESNPLNLPRYRYIRIESTEMRYVDDKNEYYRDNGCWWLKYKYIDDVLVADCAHLPLLHEKELKEITFDEWAKGNY